MQQSLPPHAKRVFKGVIFDVWQWEQKMYDGTTKIFEKIKRPDTVEIIPIVGDKILIEEQSQPDRPGTYITLPSGRADMSDDPLTEAKRELLEETGYTSNDWIAWRTFTPLVKIIHSIHYFIAHDCTMVGQQNLDAGERITIRLITFDELLQLSDDPMFWGAVDFTNHLLRCRLDPKYREEF